MSHLNFPFAAANPLMQVLCRLVKAQRSPFEKEGEKLKNKPKTRFCTLLLPSSSIFMIILVCFSFLPFFPPHLSLLASIDRLLSLPFQYPMLQDKGLYRIISYPTNRIKEVDFTFRQNTRNLKHK